MQALCKSTESITRNKTSEILLSEITTWWEGSPRTQQTTAVTHGMLSDLMKWLWSKEKVMHKALSSPLGFRMKLPFLHSQARMTNSNVNRGQVGNINDQQSMECIDLKSQHSISQPESISAPVNHSHAGWTMASVTIPISFLGSKQLDFLCEISWFLNVDH